MTPKRLQKKPVNYVPNGADPEFVRASRDLSHHLVQKYGKEAFRIGSRRVGILALMEIGCTSEEIADTWLLNIRTVKRHQSWIRRIMRAR
jgi:DNA-binding NarL/FixJ family response regulator